MIFAFSFISVSLRKPPKHLFENSAFRNPPDRSLLSCSSSSGSWSNILFLTFKDNHKPAPSYLSELLLTHIPSSFCQIFLFHPPFCAPLSTMQVQSIQSLSSF
ncbi:hypothetical protein ILYODFUR_036520 [Ilyodon furcidens]|uniref:Uncharacterized protein n=1 Tax=Ilyodon furcidens TaxID=33524 RepID=A0ABV0TF99_9TELE